MILIYTNSSRKQGERTLPSSFYETNITLIQNQNYRTRAFINVDTKLLNKTQYQQIESINIYKRQYIMIKWDLSQECKVDSTFANESVEFTVSVG